MNILKRIFKKKTNPNDIITIKNSWDEITVQELMDIFNDTFIIDDVNKFVQREIRRGNKYDAIIMDPPSYGRGAKGEVWQFEENIYDLVELCSNVLSDNPLFFLINSYTTGISSTVIENILKMDLKIKKGKYENKNFGTDWFCPKSTNDKL